MLRRDGFPNLQVRLMRPTVTRGGMSLVLLAAACQPQAPAAAPCPAPAPAPAPTSAPAPETQPAGKDAKVRYSYPDSPEWTSTEPLGDTVTCSFRVGSSMGQEQDGSFTADAHLGKEPHILVFTGMTTSNPRMKGNLGEAELTVLEAHDDVAVLLERTPAGFPVVYTINRKTRSAIYTKANFMPGFDVGMSFSGIGKCF